MIATMSRPATAAGPAGHSALPALLSRPYPAVMGVLNVTPDSFSDGGQFIAPERALAQARRMIAEGADIIDIGAESTRPYGAEPVSADEELERLRPVLADVVSLGVPVSIDSMKSAVVAWALDQGAAIANDVWGLQRDPDMAPGRGAPSSCHRHAQPRQRRSRHRHHEGYRRLLRALARDRRQGRHSVRPYRARSRHRLRQDAGAEHDGAGAAGRAFAFSACRFWSAPRASASSRR